MDPELKALLDKANGGIEAIGGDMTTLKDRVSALEKMKSRRATDPNEPLAKDQFSFSRFFKAIGRKGTPNWKGAEFEEAAIKQGFKTKAAMNIDSDEDGGFLIPAQYLPEQFIGLLYAKSVVKELGATVLDGLTGSPAVLPRMTSGASFAWLGKSARPSATNAKVGNKLLTPKRGSAHGRIQRALVNMGIPSVENMVQEDLAKVAALGMDLAALRGEGDEFEPQGIRFTSGINTISVGANGDAMDVDLAYDMIGEVEDDNADMGSLGWAFNTRITRKLRKLRADPVTADKGNYLLTTPALIEAGNGTKRFLEYPARPTTQIPRTITKGSASTLTEVYFGNWADLVLAMWGGIEIRTSSEASDGTESAFLQNEIWYVLDVLMDVGVKRPESFCVATHVITA